ncbi:MAG: amino acid adenylation domain-containing protein [Flavobacteriales bacterium]|nr:amino acid adenylation domain-containing protein [Flavobacteriales bacterium]
MFSSIEEFIRKLRDSHFNLIVENEKLILKANKKRLSDSEVRSIQKDERIIQFIKNNKKDLIQYLLSENTGPSKKNINSIYKLSGLQAGMLFLSLYESNSGAHIIQFTCDVKQLDEDLFRRSWQLIFQHRSILRTSFIHDEFNIPVQCVHGQVTVPIQTIDLQKRSDKDQNKIVKEFQKKQRTEGFTLSSAPLMKITLFRLGNDKTRIVWTAHHILFDGWSFPILLEEFLDNYEVLLKGYPVKSLKEDSFKDYIDFIQKLDKQEALEYWEKYLSRVSEATHLPFFKFESVEKNMGKGSFESLFSVLKGKSLERLKEYANENHITINTVFQGVWSILLHQYTGSGTVCFGTVVSGRPESIPNIDKRVGMYINTIPFVSEYKNGSTVVDWLKKIQKEQVLSRNHQFTPLNDVLKSAGWDGSLFDSILVFENYPVSKMLSERKWSLQVENFKMEEQTNYPLSITISISDELTIEFNYNNALISKSYVDHIIKHFEYVLDQIPEKGNSFLKGIEIMPDPEKERIFSFNPVYREVPLKTIVELFEQQVKKTPNQTALIYEEKRMSYEELNERSNRLAHYLIRQGVTKDTLVPLCMERGMEMIVAILGILKSGGAYVPIDPQYPQQRIDYMLKDTGAKKVLGSRLTLEQTGIKGAIAIDKLDLSKQSSENPKQRSAPDSAAYVIYTSGSTGQPKGVVVEHRNLAHYVEYFSEYFSIQAEDCMIQQYSFAFDTSIEEIFCPLIRGARILMIKGGGRDLEAIKESIENKEVSLLSAPPVILNYLNREMVEFGKLRCVISGGELLQPSQIDRFYKKLEVVNGYGPTETTVAASFNRVKELSKTSLLGKPISNTSIYILDPQGNPQPIGVPGELFIGGPQVARGYLNREALTKERFLKDPFSEKKGARMYKTGDLGRWTEEGEIEYLGRIDDQVKIRGYRIELGEIESALEKTGRITASVVLSRKDQTGTNRLVGYVVKKKGSTKENIQKALEKLLPEYMIPQWWVELESIPLTPNGKVDKKALPEVDVEGQRSGSYVKAETPTQEALVKIWEDLLGVEKIGIEDNFFELGGDSILTIQVVSRARKQGYHLEPRDLFTYQTIRGLSEAIGENQKREYTTEQGILNGEVGLLPIQQWYLSQDQPEVSHYNQSVLLSLDKRISFSEFEKVMMVIQQHHDTLRLSFKNENGDWKQFYDQTEPAIHFVDFTGIKDEKLDSELSRSANQYQSGLDIYSGHLSNFIYYKTSASQKQNKIILILHHLAIDGVSWRIILDHMEQLFDQILHDRELKLPAKGSSYRQFYEALIAYSENAIHQLDYWKKVVLEIPSDEKKIANTKRATIDHLDTIELKVSSELTKSLLKDVPKIFHAEINDVVLAGLANILAKWKNSNMVGIGLEGHGRELPVKSLNVTETTGWFTNVYPLVIQIDPVNNQTDTLKQVKEIIRKVPDKGMGYGVLKYLVKHPDLTVPDPWFIVFNYLGQLDTSSSGKYLSAAFENSGKNVSSNNRIQDPLSLNCFVKDGKLVFIWEYNSLEFKRSQIKQLGLKLNDWLESFIVECNKLKGKEFFTPSDYGLPGDIDFKSFDHLMQTNYEGKPLYSVTESVYNLSGLQQGMLFHSLYNKNSGVYVEHLQCELDQLNIGYFEQCWENLLNNHNILRSAFFYESIEEPLAVVLKKAGITLINIDISDKSPKEQEDLIKDFVNDDRFKGFEMNIAPLMRVYLFKKSNKKHTMLWSAHHILFDGWSMPLIIEELLTDYQDLIENKQVENRKLDRFDEYIHYLNSQNRKTAEAYWKNYLGTLENGNMLPFIRPYIDRNKGVGNFKELVLRTNEELTHKITRFCQSAHITVNTLFQGVWGFLLRKYTSNDTICFGVTVSGRPEDIEGIERKVGLFINTIPVCIQFNKDSSLQNWLQSIQTAQAESRQYQYMPLNKIQSISGITGDLFDSIMVFENYPVSEIIDSRNWALKIQKVQITEQSNYPLTITVHQTHDLRIGFNYNSDMIEPDYVNLIADQFKYLLEQFADNNSTSLGGYDVLPPEQKIQLASFNSTRVDYPNNKTVVSLFEDQVKLHPNEIAVVFENKLLTYSELNERANSLAHEILDLGIRSQSIIPICIERSLEMIVGLLAILKAGGAYLPVDPEYPSERIEFMLEDSGAGQVVCSSATLKLIPKGNRKILNLDTISKGNRKLRIESPKVRIRPADLAYVIYTSGSTGKPKGVLMEHQALINRLFWTQDYFNLKHSDSVLQKTTFSFDVSVWELFWPLITGARLVFAKSGGQLDLKYLKALIKKQNITLMHFVPSMLEVFLGSVETNEDFPLQNILCSGEALKPEHVNTLRRKLPKLKIHNLYGPTEAAIDVTCWTVPDEPELIDLVPIGKPVSNTGIYILDNVLDLLPIGVPGELYIEGVQLARGYLNRKDLTDQRFVANPFGKGKLYHTGDLARWLPDGNIEYLGRTDNQVKIRGYRIEPGEIETAIVLSGLTNSAVVKVVVDLNGSSRLVAYVLKDQKFNKEKILDFLQSQLPEYMIPYWWIELEEFPLTPNGKVDKKALPEIDFTGQIAEDFVKPETEFQLKVANIWCKLLGLEKVGINDNFFELGGDSIITIQLINRLSKEGIHIEPKDIFKFPTILGLEKNQANLKIRDKLNEQGILEGEFGLLPFQNRFLKNFSKEHNHYNQSLLFNISKNVSISKIKDAMEILVQRHDALRTKFIKPGSGWAQSYTDTIYTPERVDLSGFSVAQWKDILKSESQKRQTGLDLKKPSLVKVVWFITPENETDNRILFVFHHLVMDGVSWRIFVEELNELLLKKGMQKEAFDYQKGTSLRQWFEALKQYSQTKDLLNQISFWEKIKNSFKPLADKQVDKVLRVKDLNELSFTIDRSVSDPVQKRVTKAFNADLQDLLLSALLLAIKDQFGLKTLNVGLEGHGRENIQEDLDLNHTIGWFTSIYPVTLTSGDIGDLSLTIRTIKETLRTIPDNGLGYGVLKYINGKFDPIEPDPWEIVFNYLGQVDNNRIQGDLLSLANEGYGENASPGLMVNEKLTLNASIEAETIQLNFSFSTIHFSQKQIELLANTIIDKLEEMIKFVETGENKGLERNTPSDYGLGSNISIEELDRFLNEGME